MGHFGLHIEDWSDGASTQSQSSTSNDSGPDGTAFSFADSDTPTELTKASARGLPSSSHAAHDALAWSGIVGDDGSSFMSRGGGRGGGGSVPYDSPPKSLFERARPPRRSLSYSTMSDAAVAEERVEAEKAQDASNDASAENSIGSHGTADGLAPPPSDTRHLSSTGRTVQTRQSNPAMRRMQLLIHNRAVGGGGRRGTREERDDAETKFWLDHRQEYAIRRREEAGTPLNVSPTARRLRQRSTGTAGPANETNESSLVGAHLNSYSQAALERLSTFHTHASRHPSPFQPRLRLEPHSNTGEAPQQHVRRRDLGDERVRCSRLRATTTVAPPVLPLRFSGSVCAAIGSRAGWPRQASEASAAAHWDMLLGTPSNAWVDGWI